VYQEVKRRQATEKLMNVGGHDAAWPHHTLHFSHHLFGLREHIKRKRGNSRIERPIRKGHLADVAGLVVMFGCDRSCRAPPPVSEELPPK
jgi:hypothetical protein